MREEKRNTDNPADRFPIEYIVAKVSPKQKKHIRRSVPKCGMTVSGYIPEARLTENPESVMGTLAGCRGNLINYASTLRGMDPEKCGQMFDSYPFMPVWLKEPGRLAERISKVRDSVSEEKSKAKPLS